MIDQYFHADYAVRDRSTFSPARKAIDFIWLVIIGKANIEVEASRDPISMADSA